MQRHLTVFVILAVLALALSVVGDTEIVEKSAPDPEIIDTTVVVEQQVMSDQIVAYYFHGTRRCVTCRKIEAYSQEALEAGFAVQIADSSLVWTPVNYDEEDNRHFIDDYKLYTKTLILSRVREGKEVGWKNLDKIWELVGDKKDFIAYVQSSTDEFIKSDSAQ